MKQILIAEDDRTTRFRLQSVLKSAGYGVVTSGDGEAADAPFVTEWWMGTGSPVDLTSPAAEVWWRGQAKHVLKLG